MFVHGILWSKRGICVNPAQGLKIPKFAHSVHAGGISKTTQAVILRTKKMVMFSSFFSVRFCNSTRRQIHFKIVGPAKPTSQQATYYVTAFL
jgi:hypothetical protein